VRVVRRWREGFEIDERAAKKFGTAGIGLRKEWSVEGSQTLYAEMRVLSTSNPLIIFFLQVSVLSCLIDIVLLH